MTSEHPLLAKDKPCASKMAYDDVLERVGMHRHHWLLFTVMGLSWIGYATQMLLPGFLAVAVGQQWDLSPESRAALTSVIFIGVTAGSYFWGIFADRKGRQIAFNVSLIFTTAASLLSAATGSYVSLLLVRTLVGFGLGALPISYTLVTESVPGSRRASLGLAFQFFWATGAVVCALLVWASLPAYGWRTMMVVTSVPLLLQCISIPWVPESPRFLLASGHSDEALTELRRIVAYNGMPALLDGLETIIPPKEHAAASAKLLFTPDFRRRSLNLSFQWFTCSMVYYGVLLLTVALLGHDEDGTIDIHKPDLYVTNVISALGDFPGLLLGLFLLGKVGRRRTLAILFYGGGVSVLMWYVVPARGWLVFWVVLARVFVEGCFGAIYVVTGDAYPTWLRATGIGNSNGFSRIAGIVTPFVAESLATATKWGPVVVYSVCALLSGASASFGLRHEDVHAED